MVYNAKMGGWSLFSQANVKGIPLRQGCGGREESPDTRFFEKGTEVGGR